MKALKITTILFCLFFVQAFSFAQSLTHYRERDAGFWNIGINIGTAYQRSLDVSTQYNGFGAGLTLGKNLYYRPGAFFSFDARGSALYAQSYGLDGNRSYGVKNNLALNGVGRSFDTDKLNYTKPSSLGYYFANYKTQNGSLDLEGVLRFNRLRERTGIVLSLFGGVGLNLYQTRINQKGADGLSYATQYKTVDSSDFSTAHIQLKNILDDSYETIADGNKKGGTFTWMPTAGVELGYQFGPRFHASLFHKINFTRTSAFDGQQWDNNNTTTGYNEWQHYTGLKLEWELGSDKQGGRPPRIEVLAPDRNPYFTKNRNVRVSATIRNINNAADVAYKLNGVDIDFNFYNPRLNSDITLRPGRNEVEIVATNPYGSDKKVIVIINEEVVRAQPTPTPEQQPEPLPQPTPRPQPTSTPRTQPEPLPQPQAQLQRPVVNITYPSRSPFTTNDENISINATIINVKYQSDVRFFVNGRERNFTFNPSNATFNANTNLNEGRNEISIEAINPAGKDEATTLIIFERPRPQILPPTVRITQPQYDNQVVENQGVTLRANVTNVKEKNEIEVRINGYSSNFSFDTYRNIVSSDVTLREGQNNIEVRVNNQGGNVKDQVNVVYKRKIIVPTIEKPSVSITNPSNGERFKTPTISLEARALNTEKNDVRVYVNNNNVSFNFNILTKKIVTDVNLREGANTISVQASNNAGSDNASVTVYYEKEKPIVYAPTVNITSPNNGFATEKDNTQVTANVQNITSKNQVIITVNGKQVPSFNLNNATNITFSTRLQEGANNIMIVVENESGKANDAITVTFRRPTPTETTVPTPRIPKTEVPKEDGGGVILNPRNPRTPRTETPKDDTPTTGRTPRTPRTETPKDDAPTTGRNPRTPRTELPQGDTKPVINITSVSQSVGSPTKPASGGCTVLAVLENVNAKNQVTFTVNGKAVAFDFDEISGEFKANFSSDFDLEKGENTIVLKVQTDTGSAEETRKVTY